MTDATVSPTDGYEWLFDTDRSDGGIQIDQVDATVPELYPGATIDLSCVFFRSPIDRSDIDTETGGTVGGTNGFTVGTATGATAGPNDDPDNHVDRYRKVREYTQYAGRYALQEMLDGTLRISEHTPSTAPIPSIIVKLEPGPSNAATPGLWVVIDDADDETVRPDDVAELTLSVVVLARGDQFADRAGVRAALGSDV